MKVCDKKKREQTMKKIVELFESLYQTEGCEYEDFE
jgi:hypothetical protein